MADEAAAPAPLPKPWPQSRPRRTRKPSVSYRRRPGAASRPTPSAPGGAARLLGLGRFLPFRAFVDLFFGGVSSNTQRASSTEQSELDRLAERQWDRLARGPERIVRVSRAAVPRYSTPVLPETGISVRVSETSARVALPQPLPLPDPVLQSVGNSIVAQQIFPAEFGNFLESGGRSVPPAGGPRPLTRLEKLLELPPLPRFPELFSSPLTNPLLTTFNSPGVQSSPLANPLTLAEPLPNPEPDRCRCRARKRKAGKPGKGFFRINQRGEERRQYWRK